MPDVLSETDAESMLLGAVLGDLKEPDADDLAPESEQVVSPGDIDETEPEAEAQPAAQPAKEALPEEDYVEIPATEEGGEPTRMKVADLVASHAAYEKLRGQEAQILERVQTEAVQRTQKHYESVALQTRQVAAEIQGALQLLRAPAMPDEDMLNPQSQRYDPDGYHRAFAQYQRASAQHQQAREIGKGLLQQAQQAERSAKEYREGVELDRLHRAWPEFGQQETFNKFISDMGAAYGYGPQELDDQLTDHRNVLVARDALAYRAMKASGKETKQAVEAKAPKLVRSRQEAKGSAQTRDAKGQFAMDARARLAKTHSDDDAAAMFTGLIKAGRI